MNDEICPYCKHSLENNSHGIDQNDFSGAVYLGTCTYCNVCNPHRMGGDTTKASTVRWWLKTYCDIDLDFSLCLALVVALEHDNISRFAKRDVIELPKGQYAYIRR